MNGWTPDASDLVERAIDAHGGLARWRSARSISLPIVNGSGLLLRQKGWGRSFPVPGAFETFPHEGVTLLHRYPDEQSRGRFERGDVRIERVADGRMVLESRDHRRTFAGWSKLRSWSALDALYFFGYAVWHYHTLPFTLPEAELVRVFARKGRPAGIEVLFAPDVQTHCRRQRFWFGDDGRIVRHDYTADVIGPFAHGAHFWEDVAPISGLLIAQRRRVTFCVATVPLPLTVLDVRMGPPTVV